MQKRIENVTEFLFTLKTKQFLLKSENNIFLRIRVSHLQKMFFGTVIRTENLL